MTIGGFGLRGLPNLLLCRFHIGSLLGFIIGPCKKEGFGRLRHRYCFEAILESLLFVILYMNKERVPNPKP